MLFNAIARHFSYFPPTFQTLSFEAEIWTAAPVSSGESIRDAAREYQDLAHAPRYRVYLGMPNLAFITKIARKFPVLDEECTSYFGCGQFISDGKDQLDVVEFDGERRTNAASAHLRLMRSYSTLFEFLNLQVILRTKRREYRRCKKHPFDAQEHFVYGRPSFLFERPVFEYVSVHPTSSLPQIYSVWSRPGDQEIVRTVFSDWAVNPEVDSSLFVLPDAEKSYRWWKSSLPEPHHVAE